MLRVKNLVKTVALFSVVFGAGATVATVALSYLPMVNATPTKLAQGLKQSKGEVIDEKNGYKFQFQDCKRGIKTVVCNVLATNLNEDNPKLYLFADYFSSTGPVKSKAVDVSGNEYIAKLVKVGQNQNSSYFQTHFIKGVPTKVSLSFEIPQEVTNLAGLQLDYSKDVFSSFANAQFQNITIGGSQASNPANPGTKCTCPPQTNPKKPRPR
jgi:hypothetical protein